MNYTYDALNWPSSAATTGPEWVLSFSYDGFGNRTAQTVTKGSGPAMHLTYNPATNRVDTFHGFQYETSGNTWSGGAMGYDYENRLATITYTGQSSQFTDSYIYSLDNRHIYRKNVRQSDGDTTEEVTFRMPDGKAIGTYSLCTGYYQGHKLFFCMGGGGMYTGNLRLMGDRIGSYIGDSHFPYGENATGGSATYGKHPSGLYHADKRYYSATHGRFLTADPYVASAGPEEPASWNRYSYVGNDPINRNDPTGLFWEDFPRLMQDFISTSGGGGLPCMYDPLGMRPFGSPWFCLQPVPIVLLPFPSDIEWSPEPTPPVISLPILGFGQSAAAACPMAGPLALPCGAIRAAIAAISTAIALYKVYESRKADLAQNRAAAQQVSREPGCRPPTNDDYDRVHEIIKDRKGPDGKVSYNVLLDAWREVLCK